jgi:hypothetical protein
VGLIKKNKKEDEKENEGTLLSDLNENENWMFWLLF